MTAQSGRRARAFSPALFALMLLTLPGALEGQVRLVPQVGMYTPLSDLTMVRDGGASLFEAGKRSSSLALGLGLELGGGGGGTGLRAQIGYGSPSDIPIGGLECEVCDARVSLLTATVAAILRPIPALAVLQPYFVLGGGVKRYDFDPGTLGEAEDWGSVLRDQTQATGQVGVGAELALLGFRPQVEISAFLSRFEPGEGPQGTGESDFQTDLFLTLAIPLGG